MGPKGLSKGYDKNVPIKYKGQMARNGFMTNFWSEGTFLMTYNLSVNQDIKLWI